MKNTKPLPVKSKRRHKVLFGFLDLIVVAALVITAVAIYKNEQKQKAIAAERLQYNQAEKDLDALSAQIVAKFRQPDDSTKVKESRYTSNFPKWEKRELYCFVALKINHNAP